LPLTVALCFPPHPSIPCSSFTDIWFDGTVYATDLKVVFLCAKVKQLRSAVRTNDQRIRRQSSALQEERRALLDLDKRINEHRIRLRQEEAESIRQLRELKRVEDFRSC
jgi:hypothetical protein